MRPSLGSAANPPQHTSNPSQIENTPTENEILTSSQISYSADGGFTGVKSFGVIISCVNGKISVLKTVYDPHQHRAPIRRISSLDPSTYLNLWMELNKQHLFKLENAPEPNQDILDEFSIEFEARVGLRNHSFQVYGINRPETSRYFAIKSLIDQAAQMQTFLSAHQFIVWN